MSIPRRRIPGAFARERAGCSEPNPASLTVRAGRSALCPAFTARRSALALTALAALSISALLRPPAARAQIAADWVYGQPDFQSMSSDIPGPQQVWSPRGLAASGDGIYISDFGKNRIVFFPKDATTATRLYGQPTFETDVPNQGGLSASSLNTPMGVAVDASGLYVADWANSRVLHYPPDSTVADRVYGQPDFTSSAPNYGGLSARSICYPTYVAAAPDGGLFVSDSGNNRVLYFPSGSTEATEVYGQPNFTSAGGGLGPAMFNQCMGVAADANGVYVVDWGNNRALYFPRGSRNATRVYGQPDFLSNLPNTPTIGPNSLMRPYGCAVDEHGFYVAEYLNSRIVFFPNGSTTATVVYGQPNFNTLGLNQYGISRYGFYVPWTCAADATSVYGADFGGRVLRWPKVLTPIPASVAFTAAPAGGLPGQVLSGPVRVEVRRSDGSPAVDYNAQVQVRLVSETGPDCARLLGTSTVKAQAGVASFTDLAVSEPGTYRLSAVAELLPLAESAPFTVAAPPSGSTPGDLDGDGRFTLADIALHLRAVAGLEVLP